MEFEKVKSYLSQQIDDNGASIYSHIAAISRKIVEEKPENAYELFENISLQIKESNNKSSANSLRNNDIQNIFVNEQERQSIRDNIGSILTLYGRKPDPKEKNKNADGDQEEEEEEEEEEATEEEPLDTAKCANILEHQQLLKYAGIAFDYEEMYQLQNALNRCIRKFGENIESTRFWGKIHGINNDYYIVEAKLSEYPEADENQAAKQEDPGRGVNEYVYFVSTDLESGEWTKLNDVTPEQIKQSRQVHRLFTGNLSAKVGGRAHFGWSEAELLRAQIARISCATILAPAEYFTKPEEEDEENPFVIELNEEFAANEDGGVSKESWVHSRGHLRLEGRLKKWVEPEEEEDEEETEDAAKEEKEPSAEELEEEIAILLPISNDTAKQLKMKSDGGDDEEEAEEENTDDDESANCWFIREVNKNMPYQVVTVCNKLWNGAQTVYVSNTSTFVNIYVGNGVKYNNAYYTPTPPAVIQAQFDEFQEVEIPNPDEEAEEETIIKLESVFAVEKEQLPPPPPPVEEENGQENEEEDDGDAQQEDE
eukprot:CAMPEP_0197021510 /NCGR_PEP_ID=MMETSP1384-20130603/2397_1 /TAXON_ID=29189 /ORGANISM="Ammonia sp." /LENGTH=539 /DNA_ID=CAMNT_0042449353 /DNA_START=55 /DNA_END=1674 /DNA_ORIENTATION=+